jgi:hypothetical protein
MTVFKLLHQSADQYRKLLKLMQIKLNVTVKQPMVTLTKGCHAALSV